MEEEKPKNQNNDAQAVFAVSSCSVALFDGNGSQRIRWAGPPYRAA